MPGARLNIFLTVMPAVLGWHVAAASCDERRVGRPRPSSRSGPREYYLRLQRTSIRVAFYSLLALAGSFTSAHEIREGQFSCYVAQCSSEGDDCEKAVAAAKACTEKLKAKLKAESDGPKLEAGSPGPVCENIPHIKTIPATACGFNDAGAPNPGRFRCGNSDRGGSCREQCIFVECETDFGRRSAEP